MDPVWSPRRSPSPFQTPVRPVHLSGPYRFHAPVPIPELDPDDEPTQPGGPQGLAYQSAVLVRAFREGSPEFRAWLMRVCDLEAWAKEK